MGTSPSTRPSTSSASPQMRRGRNICACSRGSRDGRAAMETWAAATVVTRGRWRTTRPRRLPARRRRRTSASRPRRASGPSLPRRRHRQPRARWAGQHRRRRASRTAHAGHSRRHRALHRANDRAAASPLLPTINGTRYNRTNASSTITKPLAAETNLVLAEREQPALRDGVSAHALRKTYFTLPHEAGAPPRWVADQGGHSDPSTSLWEGAPPRARLSSKSWCPPRVAPSSRLARQTRRSSDPGGPRTPHRISAITLRTKDGLSAALDSCGSRPAASTGGAELKRHALAPPAEATFAQRLPDRDPSFVGSVGSSGLPRRRWGARDERRGWAVRRRARHETGDAVSHDAAGGHRRERRRGRRRFKTRAHGGGRTERGDWHGCSLSGVVYG